MSGAPAVTRNSPSKKLARDTMAEQKRFSRKEISARNTNKDAVFIIDNLVYDVTKFLDDHPGGHEVLLNVVGKDASEDFDDVGHSVDAKEMMKKYQIGELVDEDKTVTNTQKSAWGASSDGIDTANDSFFSSWKFPVLMGLLMTILYSYIFG